MKKIIYFFVLAITISACTSKGTLEGNIFWKYNDYIGNKPDAGSEIYLYPIERNSEPLTQTADVMGDFRFQNVKGGYYLLIVVSKNTTASPADKLKLLLRNAVYVDQVFGVNLYKQDSKNVTEFERLDSTRLNTPMSNDAGQAENNLRTTRNIYDSMNDLANQTLNTIPSGNQLKSRLLNGKVEMKPVEIKKDNVTTEVIDFGITYY